MVPERPSKSQEFVSNIICICLHVVCSFSGVPFHVRVTAYFAAAFSTLLNNATRSGCYGAVVEVHPSQNM